ncbi:hypothetical protein BE24_05425 [Staphylococcus xylosus]|uniref:DUF3310 domain-containing protein n=1 Tax=Staphylococcus xylosus TaxID=1288 RepID=UPI000499E752|nr:DUF3310 domain-containing protein [Staphylococcus xylosus]AID01533.1 hypothetical protein BE24_05425 [Staphylococcus xylosus]
MKIRDLNLDDYVIVYDIGKSENSEGMTVVGRVIDLIFNDENANLARINSMGNLYTITDNNYFDLWSNYIENNTEHIAFDKENTNKAKKLLSNDLQQRKRNDTVNHPSHYNYGEIEVIDFIEQVTKHYNPNVAYHIGNAIKYLARSPHKNGKEDVEKARWYIERAFENWEVK